MLTIDGKENRDNSDHVPPREVNEVTELGEGKGAGGGMTLEEVNG